MNLKLTSWKPDILFKTIHYLGSVFRDLFSNLRTVQFPFLYMGSD